MEFDFSRDDSGVCDRQTHIGDDHRRQRNLGEVEVATIRSGELGPSAPTKKATVPTTAMAVTTQPAIQ